MANLRLAVLGDCMLDVWVEGATAPCPDGCPAFREGPTVLTPGGAANAARQLDHWPGVEVQLIGPVDRDVRHALVAKTRVGLEYAFTCPQNPVKRRCLSGDGRVLWRSDRETRNHGLETVELRECRALALKAVCEDRWDAVLISDYGKGFVDTDLAGAVIGACRQRDVPVVADARLDPALLTGAILQVNTAAAGRWGWHHIQYHRPAAVVTGGANPPLVFGEVPYNPGPDTLPRVVCRNHIGAGDCFGTHLALLLAKDVVLPDAAALAHSAGRVFVQHPYGRPPWPHEVWKDMCLPHGKVVTVGNVDDLRRSLNGQRVVFTNGVFRFVTPGHCWLLDWARKQGDVLVVGINDDASAARLRNGKPVLPLADRLAVLGGLACVDWIVVFSEPTPEGILQILQPDCLVKGSEYAGRCVPGDDIVSEVRFAPESPYPLHATDLEILLRKPS